MLGGERYSRRPQTAYRRRHFAYTTAARLGYCCRSAPQSPKAVSKPSTPRTPILILDEATSSLDSHSESLIQDALDTVMRGKTVVVIAHRLSTIPNMDRIIVIEEGKIREEGTHEALVSADGSLYGKLWRLQENL
jgi:ABC-type hemin transport system ATPase subunit